MKVTNLNREQLTELKQNYYCENNDNVSWFELATIDDLVSDEDIFEEYEEVYFTEDDFLSSMQ